LHHAFELTQHLPVKTPATPLVGKGRVGESVAQHHIAPGQRGFDHLDQVLAASGKHQQRLGQRVHGLVQHQLAQFFRQGCPPRLAAEHHRPARLAKQCGHALDVRGLARTVNAFKADEQTACHGVWNCENPIVAGRRQVSVMGVFLTALVAVDCPVVLVQAGAEVAAAVALGHKVQRLR